MPDSLRVDLAVIADLVEERARVLDLGCGDGALMEHLLRRKRARGFGVEISHEGVRSCIVRGLPVFQGDIDQGLADHHDQSFDYVILSHTLQTIHRPRFVLQEMLRVGRKGIVSFPNFGHWRVRASLAVGGRVPVTPFLPYQWYDTPNIRHCTILDFKELCAQLELKIVKEVPLASGGTALGGPLVAAFANLLAPMAIFVLEKEEE